MIYRDLAGRKVSALAFGAWQIGGHPFWKNKGDKEAFSAIETALECGIDLFDTAPVYGFGHSEEILGRGLKSVRDRVFMATKCGMLWDKTEKIFRSLKPASIEHELEESLRRLGTDRIDLYQIHWPSPDDPLEPALETLARLKDSGKIRAIGVSNFDLPLLKKAAGIIKIDSCQPKYNLIEREAGGELLPYCGANGIGVLAYSPLASGLLSGKYGKGAKFDDWRGNSKFGVFNSERIGDAFDRVDRLSRTASELGVPLRYLAVNWVLADPNVTSALIGVKEAGGIKDMVKCLDRPLSEKDLSLLNVPE